MAKYKTNIEGDQIEGVTPDDLVNVEPTIRYVGPPYSTGISIKGRVYDLKNFSVAQANALIALHSHAAKYFIIK